MPPAHAGACGQDSGNGWKLGYTLKYGKFCLATFRKASFIRGGDEWMMAKGAGKMGRVSLRLAPCPLKVTTK